MLSIYTLKSASEASKYYQQGDYYTKKGADKNSLWLGQGAEKLGLNGAVDFDSFKNLLEGKLPNGTLMSQVTHGGYHRPGYDLTFSAPKSVSILALVADNQEIIKAHRESVYEVIKKIEQKYGSTRVKNNGVVSIEKTENVIVASFEHGDSRAGDPNLHTHCVLMNMTENSSGAWRTLFADEIYNDKLLNGLEYRSLLAQKLMKLGYEINAGEKGTFEIRNVSQNLITNFSKRRGEIETWLKENQKSGGMAAKSANFFTRGRKMSSDPDERKERWINETIAAGSSLKELNEIKEHALERGPIELPDLYLLAQTSVDSAISHLLERQSLFSIKEIIKAAKFMSVLPSSEGDFLKVIEEKIGNKELLYGDDKLLTSPLVKEYENNIIKSIQSSKGQVNKIRGNLIGNFLYGNKLKTQSEREALKFILNTKDRHVLLTVQSTDVLNEIIQVFNKICDIQQYYPRILCQKTQAVEILKQKIKTDKVGTIFGFLLACEARFESGKIKTGFIANIEQRFKAREAREVWVVHQDISLKQTERLEHWASVFGARIIFTQTEKQPVNALDFMREKGIGNFEINNTLEPRSDINVKSTLLNHVTQLEKLKSIRGVEDFEERIKVTSSLFSSNYLTSMIVTFTNKDRMLLNDSVRINLKEQKVLSGPGLLFTHLKLLWLTNTEKSQLHLYQLGDVLRFDRPEPEMGIQRGDYLTIKDIDLNEGVIELKKDQEHESILWSPIKSPVIKKVEVFKQERKEIMVGDRLIWTRTLKSKQGDVLNRIKYECCLVTEIKDNIVSVKDSNGKIDFIDTNDIKQQHWDYGYAVLLKNYKLESNQDTIAVLSSKNISQSTVLNLSELLDYNAENKIGMTVICENSANVKQAIDKVEFTSKLTSSAIRNGETAYKRADALKEEQDLPTQQVFHKLQAEYLNVKQFNPEYLSDNDRYELKKTALTSNLRFACNLVDRLSLKYSERESFFSLKEITKEAIMSGGLQVPVETIENAFQMAIKNGWLMVISKQNAEEVLVACKHTVLIEKLNIKKMKEGQNKLNPIFEKDSVVIKEIQNKPSEALTLGQKEAVKSILTTKDRVVAVQGIAGAGKTTALREINQRCLDVGIRPLVLANTAAAKVQAQNASGIDAMTTAQFLTRVETMLTLDPDKAKKDYGLNRLIILDETSLISSKDLFRLQTVVEKLETRLILVGDFKQLGSIGAGISFQEMLAYGIDKAVMTENVRLNDKIAFKALKEAYAENIAGTLNTLKDNIEEIPNKKEALERLVGIYMTMNESDRKETLIITPLNESRKFVNQSIREHLKNRRELQGDSITHQVLLPKDIHEVDKKEISAYSLGDFIRFNTGSVRVSIQSGDYAEVITVDNKHHRLTLQSEDGKQFYWSPKNLEKSSDVEVFHVESRELMKNDLIIFRRNNEKEGIYNGDKAIVNDIQGSTIEILLKTGKTLHLDMNKKENQHLDYGHALTVFSAQGRDVKRVLAYGEGPNPYIRNFSELKRGDWISLPKDLQGHSKDSIYHENTKLVKITKINDQQLTLKDRYGGAYTVTVEKNSKWEYFPPFEHRKEHELPLSTSQQSFIVQITRGDWLHLIVPNVDDFQKTLEKHNQIKKSALSQLDPNWERLNSGVQRLVNNISGKMAVNNFRTNTHTPNEINYPKVKEPFKDDPQHYFDKNEILTRLQGNIVGYASQWLGSPKKVRGNEARWKGALTVITRGSKAGMWRSWSMGEGGKDLISLYQFAYGISWKEAIKELAQSLSIPLDRKPILESKDYAIRKEKHELESQYELKKKINLARKEYSQGVPIQGTLAEKYLREHRGIGGDLPSDFKFRTAMEHPHTRELVPTLLAPIRDKENNLTGIVRIFLNKDGTKYDKIVTDNDKEEKAVARANLGIVGEGAVVVQRGSMPTTLWVAEGIETALSLAQSVPNQSVLASISVSNLKNIPVGAETEKVVICADKDKPGSNTSKAVIAAVETHLSCGKRVFIALPLGTEKCDFNDLIKQGGLELVNSTLEKMIEVKNIDLLKKHGLEIGLTLQKDKAEPEFKKSHSKENVITKQLSAKEIER